MPSVLADRYELRVRIGSGGMATVWRGFDRRLGREVAVKVLSETLAADETFRRRFDREAHHIASLTHPNIVVVHDFGASGDQLFIVMELVKGKSLRQLLGESSPLTAPMVARLAVDILAGLGHAHEAGILHRDIKPGNILVPDSGASKLADFGIAKATQETVDLTDSGAILGTVSYASPEQLSGHPVGPPSDLYSLGCVLYECLRGRPPFVADNIAALVSQQQFAAPKSLGDVAPDTPGELGATIMRALAKDPTRRFDSAAEMEAGLIASAGGTTGRPSSGSAKGTRSGIRTATVSVLFCDAVGSTALQSAIGDDAADYIRRKLFGVLRSAVESSKGQVVKTLGDGVMAVFPESAVDALNSAIEMTRVAPDVADGLAVRVGVSHGEVTSEEDDWFGTPVVEAARLESAAEPGTVLAAQVVRTIVGSRGGFVFDEMPPVVLKGLPSPVRAVRVRDTMAPFLPPETISRTSGFRAKHERLSSLSQRRVLLGIVFALIVLMGGLVVVFGDGTSRSPLPYATVAGTDIGYTPKFESVVCPSGTAGPGVTCGDLIVPQDRTHPKGLQVRLLVTQAAAEIPHPAPDPVLELAAPGVGAAEGPSSTARLYSNYVALSLRGGPGSIPELQCPDVEQATEVALALPPLDPSSLTAQTTALATCRARLVASGINPNDYGNDAAVADFRDLLRVLRIRQVNLLTAGSGSSLAFDIMRQYPRLLRSVSIDGPVPPDVGDFSAIANLNTALQRYSSLCAAQASCHAAFPNIQGQILRDYDEFQQHPITETVTLQPGATPIPVLLDGQSGATAVASTLAGPGITVIASELYNPDPALIATSVAAYSLGTGDYVWGQLASFECKDVLPGVPNSFRLEEQANSVAYPQLAGVDLAAELDLRWCQVWKVQPDNPNDFVPIVSRYRPSSSELPSTRTSHRRG